MSQTIRIDPITRIEGHLAIRLEVQDGRVVNAYNEGEMFRGFEVFLRGRDPLDAHYIVQRICGVCPVSHGTASVLAQDEAYGVQPPPNGRIVRNLILAANHIESHILHFYHLAALDYVDITAITTYAGGDPALNQLKAWVTGQIESKVIYPAAPFLPRLEGAYVSEAELNVAAIRHYLQALELRSLAHRMCALFAGKMPHPATLIPGGVTERVTAGNIAAYGAMLDQLRTFIDSCYLPDVIAVAKAMPEYLKLGRGCGNFLSYGVFPTSSAADARLLPAGVIIDGQFASFDPAKVAEDVKYSRYSSPSRLQPSRGLTQPEPQKAGAYSWVKAPRYAGRPMEVGPLARMLVAYKKGDDPRIKKAIDGCLVQLGAGVEALESVMGRHAARAVECKFVADRCAEWLGELRPDEPTFEDFKVPENCAGMGLTEAPRGALGHWIDVKGHRIANYQCVVPTTWNCSPRDDAGQPGPVEQALAGIPILNEKSPIEAARVVRSFDPCLACAIH